MAVHQMRPPMATAAHAEATMNPVMADRKESGSAPARAAILACARGPKGSNGPEGGLSWPDGGLSWPAEGPGDGAYAGDERPYWEKLEAVMLPGRGVE